MSDLISGRIIKGVGGLYTVSTEHGNYECSLRGIFRKEKITPTVGDYVKIQLLKDQDGVGIVTNIEDRHSILIRPKVANIDQVIIVFAITQPAINIDILDRFIILAEEQQLDIVICINKIDLVDAKEYENIKNIYQSIGYKVICTTVKNEMGLHELKEQLIGKTSVFAGPSGVGKSSIINSFIPELSLKTGELSKKIYRGKHTTRHAELIKLDYKNTESFLLDSPGFTSLTLTHIENSNIAYYFAEFRPFLGQCQFHNCNHIKERNCVIKDQVGNAISESRYNLYVKLFNEI